MKKLKGERGWTMKAFLVKLQEGFKSLGFASQLGITLGLSLAMLAGVYGISQAMSPMQKVTQVVEVQTSAPENSSTPSSSAEKKAVAEKKQETTQAPTTETVTTEKQVVTEENTREVEGNVAQANPSQERRRNEASNSSQTKEATPTEVPTVTSSSETVAKPKKRLKPLGNTGREFATLDQATAWMKEQLEQSAKDQEAGKQNWVYSGTAYEILWSDGSTTYTVDLTKIESYTPAPTPTETTSADTVGTPGTDHL